MAQITINIPDEKLTKVLDSFDAVFPGRPGGTTKAVWAKSQLINYAKSIINKKEEKDHAATVVHESIDIT